MRSEMKRASRLAAIFASAVALLAAPAVASMHYRDASGVEEALRNLVQRSPHARLYTVGLSPSWTQVVAYGDSRDYAYWLNQDYYIYAIRISADTSERVTDSIDRNSILFEAGSHPREWLTTESCLMLAEYLVEHAEDERSGVPGILSKTDVWIIPLTNVAGRHRDDRFGGDPTQFSTSPFEKGWRNTDDLRDCDVGTNLARNFSVGWNDASAVCSATSNYKGFSPFSTSEAAALRSFVQNHAISMAVVVHSNSEKVSNLWGIADRAGNAINGLARFVWSIDLNDPALALDPSHGLGGGVGQFSAWLSHPSNTAGEPDENTVRAIQTIFLELPVRKDNYTVPYRDAENDGSNGFHPSGNAVQDLIQHNFIPMAKFLTAQAATPGCNIQYGCPQRDFGLVGAKLSAGMDLSGALETAPATKKNLGIAQLITPARDYMPTGRYQVWYRVQNFSSKTAANQLADVRVTVNNGVLSTFQTTRFRLDGVAAAGVGFADLNVDQAGIDYAVTIEVRPSGGFGSGDRDDFRLNDKKVFKFRSYTFQ